MKVDTYSITRLTAEEGMIITDKATHTVHSTVVYLGEGDSQDNYIEIPDEPDVPEVPDEPTEEIAEAE